MRTPHRFVGILLLIAGLLLVAPSALAYPGQQLSESQLQEEVALLERARVRTVRAC